MNTVKKGKSLSRRYYEDLFERFEKESKWIDNEKKLEKEKKKLISRLEEGRSNNVLSSDDLHAYLLHIQQIRFSNEREQAHREQAETVRTNKDMSIKRERLIKTKHEERKTLSLLDLKEQVRLRQKENENNPVGNSLREDIQKAHTEEKEKDLEEIRGRS